MRFEKLLLTLVVLACMQFIHAAPPDSTYTKITIRYLDGQQSEQTSKDLLRMAFMSTFWDSTGKWKGSLSDAYYGLRYKPYTEFNDQLIKAMNGNKSVSDWLKAQAKLPGNNTLSTAQFLDSAMLNNVYSFSDLLSKRNAVDVSTNPGNKNNVVSNSWSDYKSILFFILGAAIASIITWVVANRKKGKKSEAASTISTGNPQEDAIKLSDHLEALLLKRKTLNEEDTYTVNQLESAIAQMNDQTISEKNDAISKLSEDLETLTKTKAELEKEVTRLTKIETENQKTITDLTGEKSTLSTQHEGLAGTMQKLKKVHDYFFENKSGLDYDKSTLLISYFIVMDLKRVANMQIEDAKNIKELLGENDGTQSPLDLNNYQENRKVIDFLKNLKKEGFTFPSQLKHLYFDLRSVSKKSYNDLTTD